MVVLIQVPLHMAQADHCNSQLNRFKLHYASVELLTRLGIGMPPTATAAAA